MSANAFAPIILAMPEFAPPPPLDPETLRLLLGAATAFAELQPWRAMYDSDVAGLIDPVTGEKRIASVLGNAGQAFGAVFYRRRAGLRWILRMLQEAPQLENPNNAEGLDALKVEFVNKRNLWKDDLAAMRVVGFKPAGRGRVWPELRSSEPGWHPWFINQTEAEQLLADLPRLTAFCVFLREHPDHFISRVPGEIPFLPVRLPDRPLRPEDFDLEPLLAPPTQELDPFAVDDSQLDRLLALPRAPGRAFEFDCRMLPGCNFLEKGRPCLGRVCLLVEPELGAVRGVEVQSGALRLGEAAGRGLGNTLFASGVSPGCVHIAGSRLESVLKPLCDALAVRLVPTPSLPALEDAVTSLQRFINARR